jgi:hypothetical protein
MVVVRNIEKSVNGDSAVLKARVDCPALGFNDFELWYRFPKELYPQIALSGNPFVPALILPSMYAGENLRIEAGVSKKLLAGARNIIQIYRHWYDLRPIDINAAEEKVSEKSRQYNAMFFSGGVDSFYTLLKNRNSDLPDSEKISHLLFLHGFDIPLQKTELFNTISTSIKKIALAYNMELIEISTNIRKLSDKTCEWRLYHGTGLASVALCMEGLFKKVYFAADHTYECLLPRGSHPLTDPLWSTESLEFINDGSEADRIEKIKWQIAQDSVAMNNLRVCFENRDGKYNCSVCDKCMRTKLNLKAAGVLDKCTTLDHDIDYKKIRNLQIDNNRSRIIMEQNLKVFLVDGSDPQLIKALKYCLSPWSACERKKKFREIKKAIRKKMREFLHIKKPERRKILSCR